MLKREKLERDVVELVNTDLLVPSDHLLRKIDGAVDFTHIYDFVEDLYCADNGRPSADPVVLIKMALIQHLYGIRSLRQTVKDIEMNIAYRWFLGYTLNETIPHFATVSYNFRHRFKESAIEDIFTWILYEVERARLSQTGSGFCGCHAYQSQCQSEKAHQKSDSGSGSNV